MMRDHGGTRTGRHDDVLAAAKDIEEMPGDGARLFAIAGVEGGLPATGLGLGKIDAAADTLKHFGHGESDGGKDLVDDAGDEEGNLHWRKYHSQKRSWPAPTA